MDFFLGRFCRKIRLGDTEKDALTNGCKFIAGFAAAIFAINQQWTLPPDFIKLATLLAGAATYFGFGASGRTHDLKNAENPERGLP